jgi:hypothetical protein
MLSLHNTQRVLHKYSRVIQSGLYGIKDLQSYTTQFECIKMLLYMNPVPNPKNYNLDTIPSDLMKDPVTQIPLIEDTDLNMRTKIIVWKPGAELDTHYHGGDDCFFQPMYPEMTQTIWQDRIMPITTLVHTHKYSYISDVIGPHSMINTHKYNQRSNVSFHLYIGEDFYDDNKMPLHLLDTQP